MNGSREPDCELENISRELEATFDRIYHQRMTGIPVINTKIGIHAVGFQRWKEFYLGVMVTPWFMNLTILPRDSEEWADKQDLSTSSYIFPSGQYKFLTASEAGIGKYQTCSLFSPMFEFADNAAAVETAEIILKELMNKDNIEQGDIHSEQISKIWSGEQTKPEQPTEQAEETDRTTLTETMNSPMSRRKLLRGTLMLGDEKK